MSEQMPAIPTVTDLDLAFPVAHNLPPLPKYASLPPEFQRMQHPACRAVSGIFYGRPEGEMTPRYDGMTEDDVRAVVRLIRAHLGRFDCKHEHKIAGCGALLNTWFEVRL